VKPPIVDSLRPDSGEVLTTPPAEATIYLDEVVNERTVGQPADLASAVIVSPTNQPARVTWHRTRITVRPKNGFLPGIVYHIELLPVITDLRNNRMRAGRTLVFSTGPAIPTGSLQGTIVDWIGGKPAPRALVEAVLMPDSLIYRAIADSGGVFRMAQLPNGHYIVYGIMDTNNDHRRGTRESYDTASADADSITPPPLELYAFAHDTTGPRLRQVEVVDSLTLKITFDRPIDPTQTIDTAIVHIAPLDDSTNFLQINAVLTPKGMDSLKLRIADSVTAARKAAQDSSRAANDTTRAPADTTRRAPSDTTHRAPADTTHRDTLRLVPRARGLRPDSTLRHGILDTLRGGRAPLDSTRAEKMLARHPAPSDNRLLILAAPLVVDTRYLVYVQGARSLSGNAGNGRNTLKVPKPTAPPASRRDSTQLRRDSTARDTTARDTTKTPPTPRRP
ncbi:MAG TPA: carboxypeptidase-like regulatory domain-containing protein, partial [Gemmatimonadales bacterium]